MLLLTRAIGDRVVITVEPSETTQVIEVVLVETRGQKARLGFKAPKRVKILRSELADTQQNGSAR